MLGNKKVNVLKEKMIHKIDSSLDIENFKNRAYECFVDVQNGWMNFDYELLRKN